MKFIILALVVVAAQASVVDKSKAKVTGWGINFICEKFTKDLRSMIDDINKAATKLDTAAHNNESKEKVTNLYNALNTLTSKTNEKLESMHPSKNPNIGTKTIESTVGSIDKGGAEALKKLQKVTSEFPGHLDRANAGLDAAYNEFEPKLENFNQPEIQQATEKLRKAVEDVYAVAFKAHTDACETRREIVAELNAKQKKN